MASTRTNATDTAGQTRGKEIAVPAIQSLKSFCDAGNITSITAYRWRKKGWLKTMNIAGRQYISAEAIAEFNRRAAGGEFAQEHVAPSPGKPRTGKTRR